MINNNNNNDNRNRNQNNNRTKEKSTGSGRSSYASMSAKKSSGRPPIRARKNSGPKFETKISEATELAHIPPLANDSIRIINLG